MPTDRTTKVLLLAIALGLWVNIAQQWFSPIRLYAQSTGDIGTNINNIAENVWRIYRGTCTNQKICGP